MEATVRQNSENLMTQYFDINVLTQDGERVFIRKQEVFT